MIATPTIQLRLKSQRREKEIKRRYVASLIFFLFCTEGFVSQVFSFDNSFFINNGVMLQLQYAFQCSQIKFRNGSIDLWSNHNASQGNFLNIKIYQDAQNDTLTLNITYNIWDVYNETKLFVFNLDSCHLFDYDNSVISGVFPFILPVIPESSIAYTISSYPSMSLKGIPATTWVDLNQGFSTPLGILTAFQILSAENPRYFDAWYEKSSLILIYYTSSDLDYPLPFFMFFNQNISQFIGKISLYGSNYSFPPFVNIFQNMIIVAIIIGVTLGILVIRYIKKKKRAHKRFNSDQLKTNEKTGTKPYSHSLKKSILKKNNPKPVNKLSSKTRKKFKRKDDLPKSVHELTRKK